MIIDVIIGVVIGGAILKGLEAWWRNRGPRVKTRQLGQLTRPYPYSAWIYLVLILGGGYAFGAWLAHSG